ncbi:peptidoglycan binding domain-containing protein [Ilyonectria destructans]|nr:peptidoglycan binding domain-containing protein [Ilyonectria destructans]
MAQETFKLASYKRIIICADGTWISSDEGNKSVPSNVAKIARAISKTGLDADGNLVKQIVFYQSGLGTGDLLVQKAIYGAIGQGLDTEVLQLYDFISNNYETGDELFFFGFSRGAFTVRSAAGIVSDVGVFSPVNMTRFPEMWRAYRANTGGQPFRKSEWYMDNKEKLNLTNAPIKVVGVWETVGALCVRRGDVEAKPCADLEYAFQALAIDEQRTPFIPTLWRKTGGGPTKDLQQCWFPGVHGNLGGQAEDPRFLGDHEEIGDNSFAWMADNLSGMLTFDSAAIQILIEEHRRALNRVEAMQNITNGWGCGPIVSNFAGLVGAFFSLLGRTDRKPGEYLRDPADGSAGRTNQSFHPIVRIRKLKLQNYNPMALKGFKLQEPHGGAGWEWAKTGVQVMPEYILRPKPMSVAHLIGIGQG